MHTVELTDDPRAFLERSADHLAADPVLTTVIATVTARLAATARDDLPFRWWATATDAQGRVVGVAMRTAPFAPYPVYALPMPEDAAVALAHALHDRAEPVGGVNGALPTARVIAEESARLSSATVRVHEHLRLFELETLTAPAAPPGRLRVARPEDAELCLAWFLDFERSAAEQAGRGGVHGIGEGFTLQDMHQRIDEQVIWLWEDATGVPVHLTGANPPAHGVARIGPVYTPLEHRGRGYAGRAVAEVSQGYLDAGVRCCLFTDQANPVSNRVYERLGYRPVVDMVNLLVE